MAGLIPQIVKLDLEFFFKSSLTILHRMAGNSQKFARIKLGIKLISESVLRNFKERKVTLGFPQGVLSNSKEANK